MRTCLHCGKPLHTRKGPTGPNFKYHKRCQKARHKEQNIKSCVPIRLCRAKKGGTEKVYVPYRVREAIDVVKLTNAVLDDCIKNPRKYLGRVTKR